MTEVPHYNRTLARFWLLFWPMLFTGVLVAGVVAGALLTLGGLVIGDAAMAPFWPLFLWTFAIEGFRTSSMPMVLAAAILAGRFAGGRGVPAGLAVLIGTVLGLLAGLYRDEHAANPLVGAFAGVAACLVIWRLGGFAATFWTSKLQEPRDTRA